PAPDADRPRRARSRLRALRCADGRAEVQDPLQQLRLLPGLQRPVSARVFLLSPATCGGERAQLVLSPRASFPLARQLRTADGAPLGEVFSFLSGLYFRGKLAYARAFAAPPPALPGVLVITPAEGLRPPEVPLTLAGLRAAARVDIHVDNRRYRRPLERDARALAAAVRGGAERAGLRAGVQRHPPSAHGRSRSRLMAHARRPRREPSERTPAKRATARRPRSQPAAGAPRRATRDFHPATGRAAAAPEQPVASVAIPTVKGDVELDVGGRRVRLTNLDKVFFP